MLGNWIAGRPHVMSALGADISCVFVAWYYRYERPVAVPVPAAGIAGAAVTGRTAVRTGHSALSAACTRRPRWRHQLYARLLRPS